VLKPDRGERGQRVVIARGAGQIEVALRETVGAIMVQAYVPGVEFGVFYIRDLDRDEGEIFSVTEKREVFVVGDGRRPLEALILADDRAVGMAA